MAASVPTAVMMEEEAWRARERRHEERLRPVVQPHVERQSRREKHPVMDFLFEYYGFRPSWLMRWSPGFGVVLMGDGARERLRFREYAAVPGGVALDPARLPRERASAAQWILALLEATRDRPPRYGCFGLHEWAMVYRSGEVRHQQTPLRMAPDALAAFVDAQSIQCSHYDAFRFFTPAARPLNRIQPEPRRQHDFEQRGCLHANMDLYKWAIKFYPWIGSDLVADAFLFALEIRVLDMQASPYDLRAYGYEPVRIETVDGRAEYAARQQALAERAQPLRLRLIETYRALCDALARAPGP